MRTVFNVSKFILSPTCKPGLAVGFLQLCAWNNISYYRYFHSIPRRYKNTLTYTLMNSSN